MIADMAVKHGARRRRGEDIPAELRRLWGVPQSSTVGRPASLDVARVVHAAVDIADRKGIDAVTLPAVAKALGCTTMALYRHIGSKDELLVLMQDAAIGAPPVISTHEGGWRDGLRQWAAAEHGVYQRRPWLSRLPISGPPSGPSQIGWIDTALRILRDTGLEWGEKVEVCCSSAAMFDTRRCLPTISSAAATRAAWERQKRTTLRSEPGPSGRSRPIPEAARLLPRAS